MEDLKEIVWSASLGSTRSAKQTLIISKKSLQGEAYEDEQRIITTGKPVSGYRPDAGHIGFIKEKNLHLLSKPYCAGDLLLEIREVLEA